jgi:amino acid transporter
MANRIKELLMGQAKDPTDRGIFRQLSLIAFLAWVGLGADGLSSSAYGPEEAFKALGSNHHLALYLALATALTVFIISASYMQIISLFPSGGGGYVVASKLLGPGAGLVSGSALLVDYVLTVALSIASGADAVFSFLPPQWQAYKLAVETVLIILLIWINMRGIKESIQILVPIFIIFVITHILLIGTGLLSHSSELPSVMQGAVDETHQVARSAGLFGLLFIMVRAYSMGGGTYTGIEAVANGMSVLREPRIKTGRKTMLYMASSLALTAGGILFCYVLFNIHPTSAAEQNMTFNALLCDKVFRTWGWLSKPIIYLTLLSEGFLLFVAAQTGFIDGPNVLSNMAADSWLPHRFANLSNRLVRQNGILLMGMAALAVLWASKGSVDMMVVLYSINVFITFSLSQLSMCLHWHKVRQEQPDWWHRFIINGVGLMLTGTILVATTIIKLGEGGWVTIVVTGSLVGLCLIISRHYDSVHKALKRLDDMLINLPFPENPPVEKPLAPEGPTAVMLVNGYSGLGIHSIFSMRKLFKTQDFANLIFVSVGRVDSSKFKGAEEIENLKNHTEEDLKRYVTLARCMGYASDYRFSLGIDVISELEKICDDVSAQYVDPIFFAGKLIFAQENLFTKVLHNQTALEIQRRMLFRGHNLVVVPIRVL